MCEEKIENYYLSADYKKCTYQTEQWNNTLSNGKKVRFEITRYFYWGTFKIELTNKEKEEILKKDTIILNDYKGVSVESLDDCCEYSQEICNKDRFTPEELNEIHQLLYLGTKYDEDMTENEDYEYMLENNGWSMDDTIYGINTGCELCICDDDCI